MARGGKREGAGRPEGSKNKTYKDWVKIGTKISKSMHEFLIFKKNEGYSKSYIVNEALKFFKKYNK